MVRFRTIPIGICANGPLGFAGISTTDHKYVLGIIKHDKFKHPHWVVCKTTSKHHEKLWPGEFIIPDLFGKGASKVQPHNVFKVPVSEVPKFKYTGALDPAVLPSFELGLKVAIKAGRFTPRETLDLVDSWEPIVAL